MRQGYLASSRSDCSSLKESRQHSETLGRIPPVEDKIGISLFRRYIANVVQEIHVSGGLKEFFGDVHQLAWERRRAGYGIPSPENIEERPDKTLGLAGILRITFPGNSPRGPDSHHVLEMFGNFPIEIHIAVKMACPPGRRPRWRIHR